jgi:hypothetical protein
VDRRLISRGVRRFYLLSGLKLKSQNEECPCWFTEDFARLLKLAL